MSRKRLGEILLERGVIDQRVLDQALQLQKLKGIRVGEALMRHLQVPKEEIAKAMEQIHGVPYAECPPPFISESVLERIPRAVAMKCCALPLQIQNNVLLIAMAEPQNLKMLDELRFCSGKQVSPRFSFREDILAGIRRYYDGESSGNLVLKSDLNLTSGLVLKTDPFAKSDPPPVAEQPATESRAAGAAAMPDDDNGAPCGNADGKDASRAIEFISANSSEEAQPVLRLFDPFSKETPAPVRLLSRMMARAANEDATELHVEPCRSGAAVRMRVGGSLRELPPIAAGDLSSIMSYLKTLACMDCAEGRIPQEGGFCIAHEERRFDIRVSTLPVHFGEKILLRILDPRRSAIALEQLGLPAPQQTALQCFLDRAQGTLIISGPAGSGKSTLLNACLNHVRCASRNIISVEDPVEQVLEGVTQVRVERRCGLTFPDYVELALHHRPDVLVIDEFRDAETAKLALRASQRGKLVITTVYANDALDVLRRLRDFRIPADLISSVGAIVGQRLTNTRVYQMLVVDGIIRDAIRNEATLDEISKLLEIGCVTL